MIHPRTKEEIARYVRDKLAEAERGTQQRLADKLGVDKSSMSGVKKGTRAVSPDELMIILEFFGDGANRPGELMSSKIPGGVRIVGRIGENIWARRVDNSLSTNLDLVAALNCDYPIEEQSAWDLEETTRDGEYRKGDRLYTVPFDKYRTAPLADDVVVIRTEQNGFERFTLRKGVAREQGVVLESVFEPRKASARADGETISGLVIGFSRLQRKR